MNSGQKQKNLNKIVVQKCPHAYTVCEKTKKYPKISCLSVLKEDNKETFFSIFLYISVGPKSLTLLIQFFNILILIDGYIHDRKLTLCIIDTESSRLCVALIWRVADSVY